VLPADATFAFRMGETGGHHKEREDEQPDPDCVCAAKHEKARHRLAQASSGDAASVHPAMHPPLVSVRPEYWLITTTLLGVSYITEFL
jgi:hypothetical protein